MCSKVETAYFAMRFSAMELRHVCASGFAFLDRQLGVLSGRRGERLTILLGSRNLYVYNIPIYKTHVKRNVWDYAD